MTSPTSNEQQRVDVIASVALSPEKVAELFWSMDCVEQADFFAALELMAGVKLCFQMAAVVREIQERADRGERDAQHGFQTMLNHAEAFAEGATDYRVWAAQREIARMANSALANVGAPK